MFKHVNTPTCAQLPPAVPRFVNMRRAVLALLAVLTAGFLASPAQADRWRPLGTFTGPPVATGDGRILAGAGDHGLAVVGAHGIERRYDLGPTCTFANVAGGGRALAGCSAASADPVTWSAVDLATGDIRPLRPVGSAAPRLRGELFSVVTGLGRRWVEWELLGNHYRVRTYWNPVTGEVVYGGDSNRRAVDLDARRPESPLCSPVVRSANPGDELGLPFSPLKRTGSFSVFVRWRKPDFTAELFAWRCGQRRAVRVSRCTDAWESYGSGSRGAVGSCTRFAVRNGLVAWPAYHGVRVMDLRRGRRFLIPEGKATGSFSEAEIGSGGYVYASRPHAPSRTTELFAARAR